MELPPTEAAPVPAEAALRRDDDAELVARAQSGDIEAFEALVVRHARRVYRVLLGITGNHADSEDGVQNTFLKAYQHVREFAGDLGEGLGRGRGRADRQVRAAERTLEGVLNRRFVVDNEKGCHADSLDTRGRNVQRASLTGAAAAAGRR